MRFLLLPFLVALSLSLAAQKIHYDFAAPNAAHHEAEVSVTVTDARPGPLTFRMSRSSPGRYATHEFGKNVYNVRAVDAQGKPLPVEKTDAEVYRVVRQGGPVTLKYTLYGNHADGTYAGIDPTNYHLNMPAAFMWVKGLERAPITLTFRDVAPNWKIATQLKPSADRHTFSAPHLQYFMDAPTKAGDLHLREWTVANRDGKRYTVRLALEAAAPDTLVDSFAGRLQRIVREAGAVWGEMPAFDFGTYTFIASMNPYVHGDGMEHRNSTMITSGRPFTGSNSSLNTFAHEFFHAWNVERLRPQSLEPFNFEKSNMSEALFIAEGFTQYYTPLLMRRAGLITDADFARSMAGLINQKENTPGGRYYTPVENSQRAVFVDAGVSVDQTNYPNMFTSYYSYGGALALALDLQLRAQGKSLDGFMQQLWKTFGRPEKPYTLPGVQQVLAAYATPAFAATFFNKWVYGHEPVNYRELLQPAGLELVTPGAGKAWIGALSFEEDSSRLVIASNTVRDTPLYTAGADSGDEIVQLGGQDVRTPADMEAVLRNHRTGDRIRIAYKHRGQRVEKDLVLGEDPMFAVTERSPSEGQKAFRKAWLEAKAGNP